MEILEDNLDNNKTDLIAVGLKSAIGLVPYAGPFLSEAIANAIPNQRMDRLVQYVRVLKDRIDGIESEKINGLLQNEEFVDLLEESFHQAARAITEERREYIASIVVNGISDETIEFQESKFLLKTLEELNDIEVVWLRSYLRLRGTNDQEFRDKHQNVLSPIRIYKSKNKPDERLETKAALQESYKAHLERLNLIQPNIRIDSGTKMPKFNSSTGRPEILRTAVTKLGLMLLKQIGLYDSEQDQKF